MKTLIYQVLNSENKVLSEWHNKQQAIHAAKKQGGRYVLCYKRNMSYDPYNNEEDLINEVGECDPYALC